MSDELHLRRDALEWLEVESEIVAMDVTASVYLAANSSGAVLWTALSEGTTYDDLVRRLCDAFEVDQDVAARDVDSFVAELRARGLLES